MQKWGSIIVRAQKADGKNRIISVIFIFSSWFTVLKLSKIVSFLQFFANISKKSESVIAIYVYASESSCFTLLKNGVCYYAMI